MAGISSGSREPDAMKVARPDLSRRGEVATLPPTQPKNKSLRLYHHKSWNQSVLAGARFLMTDVGVDLSEKYCLCPFNYGENTILNWENALDISESWDFWELCWSQCYCIFRYIISPLAWIAWSHLEQTPRLVSHTPLSSTLSILND